MLLKSVSRLNGFRDLDRHLARYRPLQLSADSSLKRAWNTTRRRHGLNALLAECLQTRLLNKRSLGNGFPQTRLLGFTLRNFSVATTETGIDQVFFRNSFGVVPG